MIDPQTPAEWQEAVDTAYVLELLESARQYGLVEGGPEINADRCQQILIEGGRRGIKPSADAVSRAFAYAHELYEQRPSP